MAVFKKIIVFVLIISIIGIVGCSSNSNNNQSINEKANKENREDIIETSWFTLTAPQKWIGKYNYEIKYNAEDDITTLNVGMNTKQEHKSALMFYVEMCPMSDVGYIIEGIDGNWVDPIGVLTLDSGKSYFVCSRNASEAACADDELDLFIEMTDEVDKCLSTFTPKYEEQFENWSDSIFEELKSSIETEPFVSYNIDILDMSFNAYKNKIGGMFMQVNDSRLINFAGMNIKEEISYYYEVDSEICVAIKNNEVVAISFLKNEGTVRDVINTEELNELFEVEPETIHLDDNYGLYLWKCENGYIGIKAILNSSTSIYGDYPFSLVVYEDKNLCIGCD